ncbi:efflux RND transporter periplasmic adaptor subunit, partial [Haliangium sp.]|uniref:efflux RND transporter periplasmic adaptor subunit n=1 Tax=Haliangium sp. TaxID=2663208 RepID=UPI003D0EB96F
RDLRAARAPAADEGVRQARARFEDAERSFARTQTLYADGAVNAVELEAAQTRLDVARSQVRAAELEAASLGRHGGEAQSALAALSLAEAQLAAARARLDRLRITAPSAGVVIDRAVEPGDTVAASAPLMVLAQAGPTRLVVEPDETNLPLLALGQAAQASAEAFPEDRFAAQVSVIAPVVDRLRGTIEVELAVPAPPPYLRTDMTVSVEIEVGHADEALVLPAVAVRDLASPAPWVLVVEDGVATRRSVELGLRGDGLVEITAGAGEDDAVIPTTEPVDVGARVRPARTRG